MSIIGSNILAGAAGSGVSAYEIEQSLRFESGDTHYLNRTPGSAGNRRTWTFSCWFKRTKVTQPIFFISGGFSGGGATQSDFRIRLREDSDSIEVANAVNNSNTFTVHGSPKFRDPSAWYHLVVAMDTTQSTASDRVKIWVNGEQITAFATSDYPSLNEEPLLNTALVHRIGAWDDNGSVYSPTSPYLAEMYHVDGTALDHEDFGEYDTNGVWRPIRPTISSYGTTGFYLDFSNSSNLGEDQAGSNDWTANNFTTSGTGTDVMSDTPTTNWCTLNPLDKDSITLANGNLQGTHTAAAHRAVRATFGITSGKWYWEITSPDAAIAFSPNYQALHVGIAKAQATLTNYIGSDAYGWSYWNPTGDKYTNGSNSSYGSTWNSSNTIGVAFDADNGTLTFYRDNASQGTAFTGLTSGPYFPAVSAYTNSSVTVVCNFGQRAFAYTPPTGFKALNTKHLPAPTIKDGSEYFNTVAYAGNSSTQSINVGFQPDFLWLKSRTQGYSHWLVDSIRGTHAKLSSDSTAAENTDTTKNPIEQFTSTGFDLQYTADDGLTYSDVNASGQNFIAWNWLAGGSGSSNTDGSITSTVSVNATAGFSIVSYSGSGSTGTIGHGLGVAPSMIIVKARTGTTIYGWRCYHVSLGNDTYINLDDTASSAPYSDWNSTTPTSTVFSVDGTPAGTVNKSDSTYIAYCFAEVEGYSKFGSYTGNGSTDGPFVYCGFKPAWVMIKNYTNSGWDWWIHDTARDPYNDAEEGLLANSSSATTTGQNEIDILSNGFKTRGSFAGTATNGSGNGYIFMAFASSPFGGSGVSPATAR